jgi:hypothetical protein
VLAGGDLARPGAAGLRGPIAAWHAAREQGLPEIRPAARDPLITDHHHSTLTP